MPPTDRNLEAALFKRRRATPDTRCKIAEWAVWCCADAVYQHAYDRTVSLHVHEGAATLMWTDGSTTSLQPATS